MLPRTDATALRVLTACLFGLAVSRVGAAAETETRPAMEIDARFPGGNIVVEKVEGDTVFLHQDLRDTEGDWFYWYFRVKGAAGRTLTFTFTRGDVMGTRGPACSTDAGKTWIWLGRPKPETKPPSFQYAFPKEAGEVLFCFAIPYLEENLKEFLGRYKDRPGLKADTLCQTKKGRNAEVLFFGPPRRTGPYRLAFTCRHHACESLANYELEGILEAMLADDETGRWYRQHVSAVLVPFVDKDGVEDGDQGKNRKPHDHNRDYAGENVHATVAAGSPRCCRPPWSTASATPSSATSKCSCSASWCARTWPGCAPSIPAPMCPRCSMTPA
jgi:hypothetical protein